MSENEKYIVTWCNASPSAQTLQRALNERVFPVEGSKLRNQITIPENYRLVDILPYDYARHYNNEIRSDGVGYVNQCYLVWERL